MAVLLTTSLMTLAHEFWQIVEIGEKLLCGYALFWCVIAIHELGHWFVGMACGFKKLEFRAGGFSWNHELGWKLKWKEESPLSGGVKMTLRGANHSLRLRHLIYVLAGPIANIATAFVVYPLAQQVGAIDENAKLFAAMSLLLGIVNLLPFRRGKLRNDGMRILDTVFNTREMVRLRFDAVVADSAPVIKEQLNARNWIGAKNLVEQLLLQGQDVGDRDEKIKALQNVLELAERGLRAERSVAKVNSDAIAS